MKLAIVAFAFAALAHAQTLADVPSCAVPCLEDAVKQKTGCSTSDYGCICQNKSAVQSAATECVVSKCGVDTAQNQVLPAVQKICDAQ